MKMKTFFKILFFLLAIFQINICEARLVVFADVISGTSVSNTFNFENSKVELPSVISENYFANTCKSESDLLVYRNLMSVAKATATKGGAKLLNQFNSAESLIQGAGNLTKVKAGMQGFVKGDGPSIFKAITNGGTRQANGTILMQDGTTIFNHFSTKTGVYTIDINKAGQIFKIRVGQ